MRQLAAALLAVGLLVAACGTDDSALTADEREWCALTDASEESAVKFDLIFEAGVRLGLDMDTVNQYADVARTLYETEGLSSAEAVQAVSDDLLANGAYVAACKLAHSDHAAG